MSLKTFNFCLIQFIFLINVCGSLWAQGDKRIIELTKEEFLTAPVGTDVTSIYRSYSFDFDNDGNIFILDKGNYRILKFGSDGHFISSFGRKGKGPGEFTNPHWITIGLQNNVYVGQRNKLLVFNNSGKYLDAISLSPNFSLSALQFYFINEKQLLASIFDSTIDYEKKPKNPNDIKRKTYKAIYNLETNQYMQLGKIYETPLGSYEFFLTNAVVKKNNGIYYSTYEQKKYQIYKYSFKGNLIKTISKEYKPVKFSAEEKEELMRMRKMFSRTYKAKLINSNLPPIPDYHNSINFLLIDSHNFLWVFTNEGKNDKLISVDLYNANDEFQKTIFFDCNYLLKTKSDRLKIHGKYAYAIIIDKNEEEKFVRFALPDEIWN